MGEIISFLFLVIFNLILCILYSGYIYACIYVCVYKNSGLPEINHECCMKLYSFSMLRSMHIRFSATKANRTMLAVQNSAELRTRYSQLIHSERVLASPSQLVKSVL